MNTAATARLSRWAAGILAVALVAGGSIIAAAPASAAPSSAAPVAAAPASAAPSTVTGGRLDWGVAADYRAIFAGRAPAAGASVTAADTLSFPAATTSTYDADTRTGTLNFTGNARIGYFAGAPVPGVTAGNYFYISNPVVTLTGSTGTISGSVAGDSHSLNPELPTARLAVRTIANLDLSGVTPTVNAAGTLVTLTAVPATITEAGTTVLARYGAASDAAASKRVAGSALDPVTIQLALEAPPVVAAPTTVALTAPATAVVGTPVTLSAAVSPAAAVGSVQFFDGATSLATVPAASGVATTAVTFSTAAEHSITAAFTPSDATLFTASTSTASPVAVSTVPVVATPTVTVSKTTLSTEGERVTVTGTGFTPNPPATSGTRPPLLGKFAGAYVSFGRYAEVWKPTEGAAASARVNDGSTTKWAVGASDVATIDPSGSGSGIAIGADGTFSVEMLIKPGFTGEPATGNYGVYTYGGGGVKYAPFETYTPITFVETPATPTASTLTAAPSTITVGASTTLTAQVAPATAGSYTFTLGTTNLGTVAASTTGAASFTVENLPVGAHTLTATFAPATEAFAGSSATASVVVNPLAPVTPPVVTPPVVAPPAVGAGSLTWGVKQSFRDYITGPIAKGAITTSGVSSSGGAFVFGQASAGTYDRATATGTSSYSGSVRFTGHNGVLDVTLADPVVRIDSATSATLLVTAGGSRIEFASLDLAAGSRSTPNNTVGYSGVPATLTAQGVAVFALNGSGFYPAGTALDPVSFVIGAPSVAPTASATVASYAATTRVPATTVPANTGITITPGTSLTEGDEVTITAGGFQPNEKGILAVVYSDPIVLSSTVTADATGAARYTGRLPAGLTGTHTLTLQGSVDRGVEITIAAKAATAVTGCLVDDASLTWGFKESFRSYISGSIANGEWTVADGASYTVPDFGFSGGSGGYDAETAEGLLAFAGSITFTGHDGLLNTTVSNPRLQLVDEASATLLLDISGTTQDGAAIDRTAVEFGSVDLTGAVSSEGGVVTITSAPAVLTAAGAEAFGTYPEGEELDPVTAAFSTAADCALPAGNVETPVTTMSEGEEDTAVVASETNGLGWILWAVLALVLIAAAVAIVLVVRRRAATR